LIEMPGTQIRRAPAGLPICPSCRRTLSSATTCASTQKSAHCEQRVVPADDFFHPTPPAGHRPELPVFFECDIGCPLPKTVFLPHLQGIVIHANTKIGDDVVIDHQVTLGVRDLSTEAPVIEDAA
jgi:hypothetical protein